MKTKQIKTKAKIGPWSSVSKNQTQKIQAAVTGITKNAVDYTHTTNSYDDVPVDELIDVSAKLAGFAYTSLLLLRSTRIKGIEKHNPGPLAHITRKKTTYGRNLLKEIHELAVGGVNHAKTKHEIRNDDYFDRFWAIRVRGEKLKNILDLCDEDKAA